jgi:hypothetical protein
MFQDKTWCNNFFLVLLLCFLIGSNSESTLAQSGATTASASGIVTDEESRIVVAAVVTARNLQTNQTREVQTNEKGLFLLNELPPGNYEISAYAQGFSKRIGKFTLTLGTVSYYNFVLAVEAGQSELVEIIASNNIDENKTASSSNNDRGRIDSLPINRRNFLDFSLTSPRVTPDRTPQQGVAATSGLSFNGLPARNNSITIDGLDNNDAAPGAVRSTFSQEAVQEFQVVSDSYSAEFGKALGGVINIITRGGSNELHSSLFFLNRNESIAARNAFSLVKPEFQQYQFGATLGGAIKKDKAFYFLSFERLSVKQNSIVGISDSTIQSINSQGFPIRNGPIGFGIGTSTFLARTDFQLAPNDSLYVRYNYGRTFNGAGEPFGDLIAGSRVADTNAGRQSLDDNSIATNNTYVNTNLNLVNETRFLYSRRNQNITPIDPNGPQVNIVAPEGLVVFGSGTLLPQPRIQNVYQIVNNVSLSRGIQQIKFGVDYTRDGIASGVVPIFRSGFAFFQPLDLSPLGGPLFTGLQAFDPSLRSQQQKDFLRVLATVLPTRIPGFPLLPLADIALPAAFIQGFTLTKGGTTDLTRNTFATFFQDDIKINSNLLLKLGVRYDISRIDVLGGNNGNVSPRVAFSYHPTKLQKMNIHGGYGLFFASGIFGPAFVGNEGEKGALKILSL